MSTSKTILVLANSIKKGGRCVAGIEVTLTNDQITHYGSWIRPIDKKADEGTIDRDCTFVDDHHLLPLDLVEICFDGHAGDPMHPEDWNISKREKWRMLGSVGSEVFENLSDDAADVWGSDSASKRKVNPRNGASTLKLIKPMKSILVSAYRENTIRGVKNRRYLELAHGGYNHQFSIDDPEFSKRHNLDPKSVGNRELTIKLDPSKTVIVASLTKPFKDGYQYKIAATIFEL